MRILITGMGGELGTRVTNLLEADEAYTEIMGVDGYPPRRRITRVSFHRVEPSDRRRAVGLVREFDPHVVVHLGVYEPNAHFDPTPARLGTAASAVSILGAAATCPSLQSIVVRSGIEVYGRRRGAPTRPDESAEAHPTSPFGVSLAHVEQVATEAGQVAGVPVALLRCSPVVGPSFPSPLGRYLRLPLVAVSPLLEAPFSLLHQEDAAQAIVAAASRRVDGPLNVVGPGAVTASQAVRRGGRIPVPVVGPGWVLAAAAAELFGAPLPPHTRELLVRGGVADGARARSVLGIDPRPTDDVLTQLYEWGEVARVGHRDQDDAAVSVADLARTLPGAGAVAQLGRRARGEFLVDEWGLDPELVALADPALSLRWEIVVEGAHRLAPVGGAVLVFNRRLGISEPWVLARGIRRSSGRFVRTVGVPDVAPVGPVLRRFGGVLDRTDEVAGLLRAGQLVGLPLARAVRGRDQAGALEVDRLEAAIATRTPVVPVALVGREAGRRWRILVGKPIAPSRRRGPLAAAELAEATRGVVQDLLDDARPPSWWL